MMPKIRVKLSRGVAAIALVMGLGVGIAAAAGFFTNGVPTAGCVPTSAPCYTFTLPLTGLEEIPADTGLAGGAPPQSEAISTGQLATYAQATGVATPVVLTDVLNSAPSGAPQTAPAFDMSAGNVFTILLNVANTSLGTPTNLLPGKSFKLLLTQDSSGSRTVSVPTGGLWTFGSANTTSSPIGLSTTANYVDEITGVYDGTKIRAQTITHFN